VIVTTRFSSYYYAVGRSSGRTAEALRD